MYTIYNTEGVILKSTNFGEANKYFFIFTRDFGLIKVAGQSTRHVKSKLRFNISDFSFGVFSVVRGKETWRLTSAEQKIKFNENYKIVILAHIFSLLLRLLQGEEKNELLFSSLKEGLIFLDQTKLMSSDIINFECIMVLKILSALGYLNVLGDFEHFINTPYINSDLLAKMSSLKTYAILEINKTLKETHL